MTIHSEHPFLDPEEERDPVRRLRGRLGGAVSLWTTGEGRGRAGLTVSSFVVAEGDPGRVLALLGPETELLDALDEGGTAVVSLLEWHHRELAEAFAGQTPAPGGPFRIGGWRQTEWGPVPDDAAVWAGVRLEGTRECGWSVLAETLLEHVEVGEEADPLVHRRGRYRHG